MQLRMAAVWAVVGMIGSSAAALAVPMKPTPPATAEIGPVLAPADGVGATSTSTTTSASTPAGAQPRFHADRGLTLDARLGHAAIPQGNGGETFLLASIAGDDVVDRSVAPMSLAIVIDKSGSMKGARMANALAAATGVVERMRDGDRVSVVAFDDGAQVVVPTTVASAATRPFLLSSIRSIRAGGDTCVSCGLEAAMRELQSSRVTSDEVHRAILLSDGAANRGVRDSTGLRSLATRMRDAGCAVTTVGLDVDFDEKVMAQIATESNGHHFFVANASDLAQVFDGELDALLATIARDAELVVEPAPGVEVAEVFDRAFRREGDRLVVPLGTFGPRQEKTALVRLRVPADRAGVAPVASVSLRWRDLVKRSDARVAGDLSLAVAAPGETASDLDPFVAARVERSKTARTLTDANVLFEQGRRDEARRTLAEHAAKLNAVASQAQAFAKAAPSPRPANAPALKEDFEGQLDALNAAETAFAQPPPPPKPSAASGAGIAGGGFAGAPAAAPAPTAPQDSREGKKAVRQNQSRAFDLAF
jgi:Ca-activated chloride channel family protein